MEPERSREARLSSHLKANRLANLNHQLLKLVQVEHAVIVSIAITEYGLKLIKRYS